MKRIYFSISFLLLAFYSFAQTPQLEWAFAAGGSSGDQAMCITTDNLGNSYTCGWFSGTTDFMPGAGQLNLTATGGRDIFIQKMDPDGDLIWVKQLVGYDDENLAYSIAIDQISNIYITGAFKSIIDFDPGPAIYNLNALNSLGIFLLKLDSDGNFIWAHSFNGTNNEYGYHISIDPFNNIVLNGIIESNTDFDPSPANAFLNPIGNYDGYIAKYSSGGGFLWAKLIGGSGLEYCAKTTFDDLGNVYAVGTFESTIDIDPGPGNHFVTSNGGTDCFILKLDTNGDFIWANTFGANSSDISARITSKGNDIYVGGSLNGSQTFTTINGTTALTSNGSSDIMLAKLNTNGEYVWVNSWGGAASEVIYSIHIDEYDKIYLGGMFSDSVDFDPGIGVHNLTAQGLRDGFVTKLDTASNMEWAISYGGNNTTTYRRLTVDNSGGVYSAGYFKGTVDFDPDINTTSYTSNGDHDFYMMKLSQQEFLATHFSASATNVTLADTIQFTDLSYGSPSSWLWDFGDGFTSTLQHPTHQYQSGGDFTVSLIIYDLAGSDTLIKSNHIYVESNLFVDAYTEELNCFESSDGSILLTINSGTPPYTINWNHGENTHFINGLEAGSYIVTITDPDNMSYTDTFLIVQPAPMVISNIITDSICYGGIDLSISGGIPPYSYNWSNGANTEDLGGISIGSYEVTVSDAHTCESTDSFNINYAASPLTVLMSPNHLTCYQSGNGSINVNITGGLNDTLSFQWSNGAATQNLENLVAGIYELTVSQNSYQCVAAQQIELLEPAFINIQESIINDSCFAAPGGVDVSIIGGTPPYTYNWSTGDTSSNISNLASGNYVLTITDANNCTAQEEYLINLPITPFSLELIPENISCFGLSNGSVNTIISGGFTDTIVYNWSDGQSTETINGLTPGSYQLTITQLNNQCELVATADITMPDELVPNENINDVLCNGGNSGFITINPSGGTPPYSYSWNNGSTDSIASNLGAYNYVVSIIDANVCIESFTFSVGQPNPFTVSPIITHNSNLTNPNGSIDISTMGGTQPLSYLWSTGSTLPDATYLASGTYGLTITDNNGCVWEDEFVIQDLTQIHWLESSSSEFNLEQNQPNPFGSSTNLRIQLPRESSINLSIYNLLGEEVFEIYSGTKGKGSHHFKFNRNTLPAGTYFIKLSSQEGKLSKKMTIID